MPKPEFRFKRFLVKQDRCAMKVGTDGVLFGAWVDCGSANRILDIGTGTGLLALIVAQRFPEVEVDAVEIEDEAAMQATENVAASPWADRIRVHRIDVRRMHSSQAYDKIICNPPYYSGYLRSPDAHTTLAKHGAELSFAALMDSVQKHLSPNGVFAVIIPSDREAEFVTEASRIGLVPRRRCQVRYVARRPPKRVMIELSFGEPILLEEDITIEASGSFDYTPEYRALIKDLIPEGRASSSIAEADIKPVRRNEND